MLFFFKKSTEINGIFRENRKERIKMQTQKSERKVCVLKILCHSALILVPSSISSSSSKFLGPPRVSGIVSPPIIDGSDDPRNRRAESVGITNLDSLGFLCFYIF